MLEGCVGRVIGKKRRPAPSAGLPRARSITSRASGGRSHDVLPYGRVGDVGHYSGAPPLREQESRRGLILLARRPAEGHSLTRVILLAAVTYLLHSRYIAIKVGIKGRKGPASCSMCFSLCAFPERSALALQEPQKPRKMGVFAIFPGLRRSVTSSNGSRSLPPAAETSFS